VFAKTPDSAPVSNTGMLSQLSRAPAASVSPDRTGKTKVQCFWEDLTSSSEGLARGFKGIAHKTVPQPRHTQQAGQGAGAAEPSGLSHRQPLRYTQAVGKSFPHFPASPVLQHGLFLLFLPLAGSYSHCSGLGWAPSWALLLRCSLWASPCHGPAIFRHS